MSTIPMPVLYNRCLSNASKAYNMPTIEDETQDIISKCLTDLKELHTRIVESSIFSPNEVLEDISTRDLVYLTVPYVFSEVQSRVRCLEREVRLPLLIQRERYMRSFVDLLEQYNVIPEDERELYDSKSANVINPAKRREMKINQFKKEKDLRGRIEKLQKSLKTSTKEASNDFESIASLLPSTGSTIKEEQELDSETDEILRGTTLLLLRLLFTNASTQLQSMEQELEILKSMPASDDSQRSNDDSRDKKKSAEEDMWRLDKPKSGSGPLLDENGRPLRAFSILPAGTKNRQEYAAQVFGPDHRLPTMTIDEYLEIEQERGGIITGGGAASQNEPTSSEQLALDAEMDGTLEGESKAEQKRQKDEKWSQYTDSHARGAGNTMNRG